MGREIPVGIEELAIALGWNLPIDQFGNWKKNPIDPKTASPEDYVIIDNHNEKNTNLNNDYIDEWLLDEK